MGLDLMLETPEGEEMCYGRKTWSIVELFNYQCRCEWLDDYGEELKVTVKEWQRFYDAVTENVNDFDVFRENVEFLSKIEQLTDSEDNLSEAERILYHYLEEDMAKIFGECTSYTLGILWDARAVLRWIDQDDDIMEWFMMHPNEYLTLVISA